MTEVHVPVDHDAPGHDRAYCSTCDNRTATSFDQIQAEYDAARAAWRQAEARLQAAGRALMAAQCGEHFHSTPGYRHHCTQPSGHAGEHGNSRFPPVSGSGS